jgi:protein-disulfide isomerase
MQDSSSNKGLIIGIVAVTALIFGGLVWAVFQSPSDQGGGGESEQVSFNDENAPYQGPSKNALVTVQLYSDFQCPACKSAEAGVKPAIEKYRELGVKFVWKDFPLPIHRNARAAANAARCANDQGWFWSMHNMLYDKQTEWSDLNDPSQKFIEYFGNLKTIAPEGKFNDTAFASCLGSKADDAKISADIDEGYRNRVDRTPTVFIGNRRYFGMSPTEWDQALSSALEAAKAAASSTRQNIPAQP